MFFPNQHCTGGAFSLVITLRNKWQVFALVSLTECHGLSWLDHCCLLCNRLWQSQCRTPSSESRCASSALVFVQINLDKPVWRSSLFKVFKEHKKIINNLCKLSKGHIFGSQPNLKVVPKFLWRDCGVNSLVFCTGILCSCWSALF